MKISQFAHVSAASLLALSLVVGCGTKTSTTLPSDTTSTSDSEHGHDHGPDGHDHEEGGHSHGVGPHGGTVADWGGGTYHVEFTVDHDKQEATVYVLGSDETTPEPVKAESLLLTIKDPELQTDLLPVPLDGESAGTSSRFVGSHDGLAKVMEYEGIISAEVDGTPYAGNFKEEAHGGHGHSHGEDDALVWEGEPKEHAGMVIKLGHHGARLHAGEEVEPAVSITRDGEPVSDAKVFNALLSSDGQELAKEVATVYEPTTEEEPAHYAQGGLMIPAGSTQVVLRFRIVPASGEAVEYDVPITVE